MNNRSSVFMELRRLFVAALLPAALSSCAVSETGQLVFLPTESKPAETEPEKPDTRSPYYSSVHHIVVHEKELPLLNPGNSRIAIDLGEQRARIYRQSSRGDKLVIETQISTGKQGHSSPSGNFKILEKTVDKKSNLYGKWVDASTGSTLISDGDIRKPPKSGNGDFRGAPMPYWMRITPGGVGMHIGYVPNYPASHGCIRVPKQVQPLIFSKTRVGTPVTITH